jgi:hypothetical protein
MPVRWMTAGHRHIVAHRYPGNLQLEITLVAPKPRHLLKGLRVSNDMGSNASPLIHGVLH